MFDEKFLWDYHSRLMFHFQEIFEMDKSTLHCFLDSEFQYKGRCCYTGETWCIPLSDQIKFEEKTKIDEQKKNGVGLF